MSQRPPLSAHELRDAVRHGMHYDIRRLDRILGADPERGLIEVQAGTLWGAIARHLSPENDAAAALGDSLPRVGTSVAWNAAGPDGRPMVEHVEGLALVTPDGELRRATRTLNAELFALAVGGQDLFGPLYSVTLRTASLAAALRDATEASVTQSGWNGSTRSLQLLVPPEALPAMQADVGAICDDWRVQVARQSVRRTCAESVTFLPWARQAYVQLELAIAVPGALGGAVRLAQVCRAILDACLARGGSFSIARTLEATREQVDACYPGLARVLAEKRRIDPAERIVNGWYRHHRSLLKRQRCESRWGNA
jgi:FAD/FMN-containing dehydrogenase